MARDWLRRKMEGTAIPIFKKLTKVELKLPAYVIYRIADEQIFSGPNCPLMKETDAALRNPTPDYFNISRLMAQLFDYFCWSAQMADSTWRDDFYRCLHEIKEELPFIYDKRWVDNLNASLSGSVDNGLLQCISREMQWELENVQKIIEAYEYGNGFPALRASGFVDRYHNRLTNWILAGWLYAYRNHVQEW